MVNSSIKVVFIVVGLLLTIAFSQSTTKSPTVVCKAICDNIYSNSNTFKTTYDMSLNFTKTIFRSTSAIEVFKGFKFYSSNFKAKQINNILAFTELKSYGDRLQKEYGADNVRAAFKQLYPDSACIQYDSNYRSTGVTPLRGMFEGTTPNFPSESVTVPGIFLPINQFPSQFQDPTVYQPGKSLNDEQLKAQYDCWVQRMIDYQHLLPNPNLSTNRDSFQHIAVAIKQEELMGFSNMLFYAYYGDQITDIYWNCGQKIYADTCS